MKRITPPLLVAAILAGCAAAPLPAPGAEVQDSACSRQVVERAYFGLQTPRGEVTAKEWRDFLAVTVTPKFPHGLTVIEGRGQWLGDNGKIVQEPSRVLEVLHDATPEESEKLREVALEYRKRFDQDAVMILRSPAEACFYTRSAE